MRNTFILLALVLLPGAVGAAEVGFAIKPAAVRDGDPSTGSGQGKVKISFTASAPTDVEVAILGTDGKVVRHLAAGVLGPKAPAPLKPGLAQELFWDGKDDYGKALPSVASGGGGFKVRVALGLKPTFERMIGDNPGQIFCPQALAVSPKGELYVLHIFGRIHPEDNSAACTVFDRNGKYLRTILPYPANLSEEKLAGIKRIELSSGAKAPFLYDAETRAILAGAGNVVAHQPVATADGRFVFIGHIECPKRYNNPGEKQVTVINGDGSMPTGGPYRTALASWSKSGGALALAPDGETFYATGIAEEKSAATAVLRFGLDDKEPTPFINKGLKTPTGLAVDKEGNVYVADGGAGQVAVFKPDGSPLGALKADKPDQVTVSPRTGAVYVFTEGRRVLKFDSWKAAAPAAAVEVKLATTNREHKSLLLAVDSSAEPTVVWAGIGGGHFSSGSLGDVWRIEDRGGSLGAPASINSLAGNDRPAVGPVKAMALDRANRRLLVNTEVFDLASGKWSKGLRSFTGMQSGVGSFGLDGKLYVQSYFNKTARYGPDLKPLPFAAGTKGLMDLTESGGVGEIHASGVTADPAGNVYLIWNKGKGEPGDGPHPHDLALCKPDGTVVNKHLVSSQIRQLCSVRLDLQGNIYLGVGVRPAGTLRPEGLKGDLGKPYVSRIRSSELEWYERLYGCIVKFGPDGGAIRAGAGGVPVEYGWAGDKGFKAEIKGAKWLHFGASPVVSWRNGFPDVCFCESPRFDVDRYARVFYPDAGRFRVGVLDTGGNEICTFGAYGNPDSAGPKSAIPTPDIPLFWPYMIEADDGAVYIGDRLNRRVVEVKLEHAAEETCEVK
jgi:hypothetical protein